MHGRSLTESRRGAEASPDALIEAAASTLAGLRVLAAEDNASNQLIIRTLLQRVGVSVDMVDDGAQAVAAWQAGGAWDVILLDVMMPVMDGPAAARRIRALEMQLGRGPIPIIALTANSLGYQIESYLEAGMDFHLAKPIEIDKLFALLAGLRANAFDSMALRLPAGAPAPTEAAIRRA